MTGPELLEAEEELKSLRRLFEMLLPFMEEEAAGELARRIDNCARVIENYLSPH